MRLNWPFIWELRILLLTKYQWTWRLFLLSILELPSVKQKKEADRGRQFLFSGECQNVHHLIMKNISWRHLKKKNKKVWSRRDGTSIFLSIYYLEVQFRFKRHHYIESSTTKLRWNCFTYSGKPNWSDKDCLLYKSIST